MATAASRPVLRTSLAIRPGTGPGRAPDRRQPAGARRRAYPWRTRPAAAGRRRHPPPGTGDQTLPGAPVRPRRLARARRPGPPVTQAGTPLPTPVAAGGDPRGSPGAGRPWRRIGRFRIVAERLPVPSLARAGQPARRHRATASAWPLAPPARLAGVPGQPGRTAGRAALAASVARALAGAGHAAAGPARPTARRRLLEHRLRRRGTSANAGKGGAARRLLGRGRAPVPGQRRLAAGLSLWGSARQAADA